MVSKSELVRLLTLLSPGHVVMQDPVYPAYQDLFAIYNPDQFTAEAMRFDLNKIDNIKTDILLLCNHNNPTGHAFTHSELSRIVNWCIKTNTLLIYDNAYGFYASKETVSTIYEIKHATRCAIELSSFSKIAGFTGLRCGWTVVPRDIVYASSNNTMLDDWIKCLSITTNGPSKMAQLAARHVFEDDVMNQIKANINEVKSNAKMICHALQACGFNVTGDINSPFVWAHCGAIDDMIIFDRFLHDLHIICVPGSGFGEAGKHHVRFSALQPKDIIQQATQRILHKKKRFFTKSLTRFKLFYF